MRDSRLYLNSQRKLTMKGSIPMRRPSTPNAVIPGCGFHHVAIRTADWPATLQFWGSLGFTPAIEWGEAPRRACMLDSGDGNYLEVFERDPIPGGPSDDRAAILHFCFRTGDLDESLEKARAAGAEVTMEPKDVTIRGAQEVPVRIAFFKGPNGEICELFQNEVL